MYGGVRLMPRFISAKFSPARLTFYTSLIGEVCLQVNGENAITFRERPVQLPLLKLLRADGFFIMAAVHLVHQGPR